MRATTSLREAGAQLAGSADGSVPAGKAEGLGEGAAGTPSSGNHDAEARGAGCVGSALQPSSRPQNNNYDCPLPEEEPNPKGSSWLYHSDAVRTYLNLMGKSKKDATLEACAGALQNLTASKGLVSAPPRPTLSPPWSDPGCPFPPACLSQGGMCAGLRARPGAAEGARTPSPTGFCL